MKVALPAKFSALQGMPEIWFPSAWIQLRIHITGFMNMVIHSYAKKRFIKRMDSQNNVQSPNADG